MTERLTAEELAEYRKIAATQMVLLSREDANKLLDAAEECERLRAEVERLKAGNLTAKEFHKLTNSRE